VCTFCGVLDSKDALLNDDDGGDDHSAFFLMVGSDAYRIFSTEVGTTL